MTTNLNFVLRRRRKRKKFFCETFEILYTLGHLSNWSLCLEKHFQSLIEYTDYQKLSTYD